MLEIGQPETGEHRGSSHNSSQPERGNRQENAPTLLLMAGFAGAGKTTLAQALRETFGWKIINKDDFKLRRLQQSQWYEMDDVTKKAFIEQAGFEAFQELLERTRTALLDRASVIVDTSNEKPTIFDDIQKLLTFLEESTPPIRPKMLIVLCSAAYEVRAQRLYKRGGNFEPFVTELPDILDDSELPGRFRHLFDWNASQTPPAPAPSPVEDLPLPELFSRFLSKNHMFFADTNQPLQTYINHVQHWIETMIDAPGLVGQTYNCIECSW